MRATLQFVILLLALHRPQEEDLKKRLEALRSDEVSERDRAFQELKKTPLRDLHLLEPELDSRDPELRGRVREVVTAVLSTSLGKRLERFSARPVASRAIFEQWARDGRDPARIPKGFDRIRKGEGIKEMHSQYDYLRGEEILVESESILSPAEIVSAEARESLDGVGAKQWVVAFELTSEGAKRFDQMAERLYAERPQGILALIVDGGILSAPVMQSPSFGGHGTISGGKSREECERLAGILKGTWVEISFRLQSAGQGAAPLEEALRLVRGTPGFGDAKVTGPEGRMPSVESRLDSTRQDLVGLWQALRQKGYSMIPAAGPEGSK
ncbi:MAG TPA: hypothetical protein VEN81_14370 [Planctomycetota bacterium]|nr:hypothetical protein [Planctomycetota bacterium]